MNINSLINILDESREVTTFEHKKISNNGTTEFYEIDSLRLKIQNLEKTGLFQKEIQYLRNSALFKSGQNTVTVNHEETNAILKFKKDFKKVFDNVYFSLQSITNIEKENSIRIKLPPTNDIEDLSKVTNDIHKIFSQVIFNEEINGKLEITSVENGSIWIVLYVGSVAAVTLIGGMVWSASVIYKKIQEGRILEKQVRSLEIRNDSFKEIQDKQALLLSHIVAAETQMLIDENFKTSKPEQVERMKNSIKMLAEIIDKGGEIHPALGEPEKVQNLFPKTDNLLSIVSKVKELQSGEKKDVS